MPSMRELGPLLTAGQLYQGDYPSQGPRSSHDARNDDAQQTLLFRRSATRRPRPPTLVRRAVYIFRYKGRICQVAISETNFSELRAWELRGISLPRRWVNSGSSSRTKCAN